MTKYRSSYSTKYKFTAESAMLTKVMLIVRGTKSMHCLYIGPPTDQITFQELIMRYSLTDEQLNSELRDSDFPYLAEYFDCVTIYSCTMGLTPAEQADVNDLYHTRGTQVAITECLILWKRHDPYAATYRALLELLLRLRKKKIAEQVCQHLTQCEYNHNVHNYNY